MSLGLGELCWPADLPLRPLHRNWAICKVDSMWGVLCSLPADPVRLLMWGNTAPDGHPQSAARALGKENNARNRWAAAWRCRISSWDWYKNKIKRSEFYSTSSRTTQRVQTGYGWSAEMPYLNESSGKDPRQLLHLRCSLMPCWWAWPWRSRPKDECLCCSSAVHKWQWGKKKNQDTDWTLH